jgi:hypothetical protein
MISGSKPSLRIRLPGTDGVLIDDSWLFFDEARLHPEDPLDAVK